MTETFYDVLGVAEDATTDEIESAYRELLKQTHPDVSDDEDAGQATKTLIEARDVLVDEDERARYDRVGHEAYVGDGEVAERDAATETSGGDTDSDDGSSDTGDGGGASQSRARREQRASERVRQERRKARDARQRRRETAQGGQTGTVDDDTASASAATSTTGSASDYETTPTGGRRAAATDTTSATASASTYSVRENVATPTSNGPLLPQGRQLTLLGIFFALYPVLLFSALLPAFPPFVNVILTACTLVTIMYLQSMPRVALLLFGGWSVISVVGLGLFGVGYVSPVGLIVLLGTIVPFGFSVLTAAALRY